MGRPAWQPARAALHRDATHLAEGRNHRACFGTWLVLDVVMDVSRNKQVQPAVPFVIAPGCTIGPVAQRDAGLLCNIGKGSVVIVVVKAVLAKVGDKNIRPAVIVIVTDG